MLAMQALSQPRQRATEALETVADHYGLHEDMAAVEGAGDGWRDLAIVMLAEAVAALLLDVPSRPGSVERRRHR